MWVNVSTCLLDNNGPRQLRGGSRILESWPMTATQLQLVVTRNLMCRVVLLLVSGSAYEVVHVLFHLPRVPQPRPVQLMFAT